MESFGDEMFKHLGSVPNEWTEYVDLRDEIRF